MATKFSTVAWSLPPLGSTVHKLTHAGHRKMDTFMFDVLTSGNKERLLMRESWAEGVETIVTNDR